MSEDLTPAAIAPPKKKLFSQIFSWLLVAAILFFLLKTFIADIDTLKNYNFQFNFFWLALAFITHLAAYAALSYSFYFLLRHARYKISFIENLAYTIFSQFGSYVPGKVWVYIIRYRLLKKHQVSDSDFLSFFALDTILLLGSAGFLSCFFAATFFPELTVVKVALFIILLLAFACLHPKIFYPVANRLYKLIKRPEIPTDKYVSYVKLIIIFFLNIIFWLVLGSAFFFFVKSIIVISFAKYLTVVGVYILAVWLGFLALIVPNGLGVREWVKTRGLASFLPLSLSIMLSISSRMWSLANELLWSLLFFLFIRKKLSSEQ